MVSATYMVSTIAPLLLILEHCIVFLLVLFVTITNSTDMILSVPISIGFSSMMPSENHVFVSLITDFCAMLF